MQYAKGLGTHAPGVVEYYVAGRCTGFTADVGLDDEKGNNGNATFEVWADGRKVADSGALTNLMPAKPLSADITGATLVRLISTDAGDGNNSDHTDWADARSRVVNSPKGRQTRVRRPLSYFSGGVACLHAPSWCRPRRHRRSAHGRRTRQRCRRACRSGWCR
ncbi:NPCBM/NEW2 domain-containing protein [Kibdelosporangium philippinense]|uniref:NPCBM/NEW2 domain-containing protein n=1 Tax=Kibdelosporangium philippinense TaxID=211113 RepID=UPI00361B9AB5